MSRHRMVRNLTEDDYYDDYDELQGTYTAEGITAVANALKVTASLTQLDVEYNRLGEEGETVLRTAVEGRSGFELKLCENDK